MNYFYISIFINLSHKIFKNNFLIIFFSKAEAIFLADCPFPYGFSFNLAFLTNSFLGLGVFL